MWPFDVWEEGPVANAREGSTQEHDWARVPYHITSVGQRNYFQT